jgi:hypothetical protein
MKFDISSDLCADCQVSEAARIGHVYHVARNSIGSGMMLTPIANYFVRVPEPKEGFVKHWRVDCFVRRHKLAPRLEKLADSLVRALKKEKLCEEPIWITYYEYDEIGGQAYGEVFDNED